MIVSNTYKFVFVAIPKTGTRSVYTICQKQYEFFKIREHLDIVPDKYNSYKKFTVVRNPYDRFISLWWATCMREKGNQHPNSAAVIIKTIMNGSESPHKLLEYMIKIKKNGSKGPGKLFTTQFDYLSKTKFDYILHTENLNKEIFTIPFIDSDIKMPSANSSKKIWGHNVKARDEDCWVYIDQELLDMINEYYEKDFELLSEYEKLNSVP